MGQPSSVDSYQQTSRSETAILRGGKPYGQSDIRSGRSSSSNINLTPSRLPVLHQDNRLGGLNLFGRSNKVQLLASSFQCVIQLVDDISLSLARPPRSASPIPSLPSSPRAPGNTRECMGSILSISPTLSVLIISGSPLV